MDTIIEDESPRARLALLLKHFSAPDDDREAWRILYPIEEVLLLVTCATIASCDDFDDIVAWGEHHLGFLRRVSAFHPARPCRTLAARPGKPRRSGSVQTLLRELGSGSLAGPARVHRHRRKHGAPHPRSSQ